MPAQCAAMIDGLNDADLIERVRTDLSANGIEIPPEDLRGVMLRVLSAHEGP